MDNVPFVYVTWNAPSYPVRRVLSAGLDTILVSGSSELFGQLDIRPTSSPNEYPFPGTLFNFTSGKVMRVEVGRRQIYAKKGTLRELFGISERPDVYLTYPPVAISLEGEYPNPNITSLTFYPRFGPFTDEIYEEHLDYTFLSGLSATGKF
ncbi:hypothetical protein FRC01_004244 [Tulasnella sp. 417]|nr:hypothetical protein FRC01_004244 [Tulasnella sp. 417]